MSESSTGKVGRISAARLQRKLQSKEDVPLVEDFPLAPEEETPELNHLKLGLQLRLIQALEHWLVTLT